MQKYHGVKTVDAFKIAQIIIEADPPEGEAPAAQLVDENDIETLVSAEYMAKHQPEVGGYYVQYADGYESYSPAEPFEAAYKPVGDERIANLKFARLMDEFAIGVHKSNVEIGWWDGASREDKHLVPAKLALIHSELSEALEGDRKSLPDTHLKHRPMVAVELADAIIRIFDLAGWLSVDIGTVMLEKIAYNRERADHKRENRAAEGGKKY